MGDERLRPTKEIPSGASFHSHKFFSSSIGQFSSGIVWNCFALIALFVSLQLSQCVPSKLEEDLWIPHKAVAAMSSGQGSTPAGRSAAEKGTAKAKSPKGSDSGYSSTANTTDGSTTDHSRNWADGVAVRLPSFFERRDTKPRLFDREIPKSTQDRFHDLHELFGRALCDHLNEAKINPYPISLKLKCWGESEATARPCIVVLCNKSASKRVRHFFNQQHIRAAYQPSNPDSSLPSFDIRYFNWPPKFMAGLEIYGDLDERSTMCGRVIKVGEAHESRFATLGGVIRYVV